MDTRKLLEAVKLINEFKTSLDISIKPCTCCNRGIYANWNHFTASKEITASADKLLKWAVRLTKSETEKVEQELPSIDSNRG